MRLYDQLQLRYWLGIFCACLLVFPSCSPKKPDDVPSPSNNPTQPLPNVFYPEETLSAEELVKILGTWYLHSNVVQQGVEDRGERAQLEITCSSYDLI